MPTAQINVRIPAEYHDLVRIVAAKLREDEGFAALLAGFVAEQAGGVAGSSRGSSSIDIIDELTILRTRLDAVEAEMVELRQEAVRKPVDAVEPVKDAPPPTPEIPQWPSNGSRTQREWSEEEKAALQTIGRGWPEEVAKQLRDAVEPVEAAPAPPEALPRPSEGRQKRMRTKQASQEE
jgi:hypothetical protein